VLAVVVELNSMVVWTKILVPQMVDVETKVDANNNSHHHQNRAVEVEVDVGNSNNQI